MFGQERKVFTLDCQMTFLLPFDLTDEKHQIDILY